jgi:putative endonuclease
VVRKPVSRRSAVSKRKSKKELGNRFEAQAVHELHNLGWTILDVQYHTPYGEIDIVALHNKCLWFVEVKGSSGRSISFERVSHSKQRRFQQSVEHWLMSCSEEIDEMEMVVCFRTEEGLHWIRNAFDGTDF